MVLVAPDAVKLLAVIPSATLCGRLMPALLIWDETPDQSPVAAALRMLVAVSTFTVPLCMPLASAVAALRPASPISMPMLSSVVMMLCDVPSHDATS